MNPATLVILIEQAKIKTEAAQMRFAAARRTVDQARKHLDVLRRYAQEYDDRAGLRTGDSRDPSAERNQMQFLARLSEAVQTQEREVEACESAVQAAAQDLAACQKRHKSLETLAQRQRDEVQRAQARRDQKSTDEFAQRAHSGGSDLRGSLQGTAANAGETA
jgi:flagellar FliJ protein